MAWKMKKGYSRPSMDAIRRSMNGVNAPNVNGTYIAMHPVNFRRKKPFHNKNFLGETDKKAPMTCGHARTAFDLGWVHDDDVKKIKAIAKKDGLEWRAEV